MNQAQISWSLTTQPFNRRLLVHCSRASGMRPSRQKTDARRRSTRLRADARQPDPIDVVLLDIVMPESWTGTTRWPRCKADDALRDVPVIVISGVDELDSVVRCIRMGAADYLPKTVDPEILRARIEASLAAEATAATTSAQLLAHDRPAARRSSRGSCRRRSPRSSRAPTARRCWRGIDARSPRCSATCATSRSSRRPPSPRRSWASCAPTTRRWASSSSSTKARSSTSPATGS